MTNGILAAKIMSDIINNKKNEFIELFNPYRKTNIKKIANNIKYNYYNIKSYIKPKKQSNIKHIKENGIEYAIYIDEKNKEHKIINKCPHMKCKLTFNELDKTWDCPCHGSRYTIDGKIIKGPSTYSIIPKRTQK
jgi:Rieske Fe-S protein